MSGSNRKCPDPTKKVQIQPKMSGSNQKGPYLTPTGSGSATLFEMIREGKLGGGGGWLVGGLTTDMCRIEITELQLIVLDIDYTWLSNLM
jgi:hypothetical protein